MKGKNWRPPLCTECKKADVKAGGYYVRISQLFKMTEMKITVVEAGEQYDEVHFEHFLCGKECLMKRLNIEMDNISRHNVPQSPLTSRANSRPDGAGEAREVAA